VTPISLRRPERWAYDVRRWTNFDDNFSRFDTIPDRDRQTDSLWQHIQRFHTSRGQKAKVLHAAYISVECSNIDVSQPHCTRLSRCFSRHVEREIDLHFISDYQVLNSVIQCNRWQHTTISKRCHLHSEHSIRVSFSFTTALFPVVYDVILLWQNVHIQSYFSGFVLACFCMWSTYVIHYFISSAYTGWLHFLA